VPEALRHEAILFDCSGKCPIRDSARAGGR